MKKLLLTSLFALVTMVTAQGQTYCVTTAGPSSTADSELTGVQITGDTYSISQMDANCGLAGVQDFTASDSADISTGASYTVSVTMGTCGGNYGGAIAAWIDYNADGDFDDAGEQLGVYAGTPTSVQDFTFIVPAAATLGKTRMRVMQQEGGSATGIGPCNSFSWGAVEDYTIRVTNLNTPSCTQPSALVSGAVSFSAMDILWSGAVNGYDVEYDTTGFTLGTGVQFGSTVDSVQITGLTAQTSYDVYVRSNCKADGFGTSAWTGPLTVTTGCAPQVAPFSDDLEAWAGSIPSCWSGIKTSTSGFGWTWDVSGTGSTGTGPNTGNSGISYLYLETSGGAQGDVSYANLPVLDLSSIPNAVVEYAYHMVGATMGDLTVEVSSDNMNWTTLSTISGQQQSAQSDPYNITIVDLTGYTSGQTYIRFGGARGSSYTGDMAIDDIYVGTPPACPVPTNLAATTTLNDASLTWNALPASGYYLVEHGLAGFTPGTGDTLWSSSASAYISGLQHSTAYDFYVTRICGTDTASPLSAMGVTTLCGISGLPYDQDFEARAGGTSTNPDLPICWEQIETGTSTSFYSYVQNSAFNANSGSKVLYFYGYFSTTSTNSAGGDTLANMSPMMADLNAGDKQVTFHARSSTSTSTTYNRKLIIGTADAAAEKSSIHIVDTVDITTAYDQYFVDLTNVPANASRVVFMIVPEQADTAYTYAYTYAYVDDIQIRPIPTCIEPLSVTVDSVDTYEIDLSWIGSVNAGEYVVVEYGPTGFTPGTGDTSWVYDSIANISGLMDATTYDFYLTKECGPGNTSVTVGPISGTTLCGPLSAPYFEDMESGMPLCWSGVKSSTSGFGWTYDGFGTGSSGTGPLSGNSGDYYVYLETSGTGTVSYASLKEFNLIGSSSDISLAYAYHMVGVTMGSLTVEVSTDNVTWDTLAIHTGAQQAAQADAYLSGTVSLAGHIDSTTYIRFGGSYAGGFTGDMAIDDIYVGECPPTANVSVAGITPTSGIASWTSNGSYQAIVFDTAGFDMDSSGTMVVSNSPYEITGLTELTSYDFYILDSCGGAYSVSGPFTFATPANCIAPYSVNAEASFFSVDLDWSGGLLSGEYVEIEYGLTGFTPGSGTVSTVYDTSATISGLDTTETYDFYLTRWCSATASSTTTGPITVTTINLPTEACGALELVLTDSYGDSWNGNSMIVKYPGGDSSYTVATGFSYTVPLSVSLGDTLSFSWSGGGSFPNECTYQIVDVLSGTTIYSSPIGSVMTAGDVQISIYCNTAPPSCTAPVGAAFTAGIYDAEGNWPGTLSAGEYYLVEYDSAGFTAGTGDTTWVYDTTVVVTGLSPQTNYDFYVTKVCSSTDSSATLGPLSVTTSCAPVASPLEESFDGWAFSVPSCWSGIKTSTANFGWTWDGSGTGSSGTGPLSGNSGSYYLYLETSGGSAGDVSYATLPGVDLSGSSAPVLSFAYHMHGATMGNLTAEISLDQVNWDTLMIKSGQQQALQSAPYADTAISLAGYAGNVVYVRFGGTRGTSFTGDMALDDVYVGTPASCDAPTGLSVPQIYSESVELDWSGTLAAGESYEVEYGLSGFSLGSGATTVVYDTAATIGGLTNASAYDFYVTKYCTATDFSSAATVSASTLPTPTQACGNYELRLLENYGDGWNGNTMTVTSNNAAPSTLSVPSGFLQSNFLISAFPGDTLQLVWDGGGSYQNECSFELWDMSTTPGTPLFVSLTGDNMVDGHVQYEFYCDFVAPPACIAASGLVVNSMQTMADLSWTGDSTASYYVVEYGAAGFTLGTGDTMHVYGSTMATVTGLDMSTSYEYYVTSHCSATSAATPHGPVQSSTLGLPTGVSYDANGCQECDSLNVGDFFVIDGDSIEVVDKARLVAIVAAQGDLTKVCVSHITDMKNALRGYVSNNYDIGHWDVSNVTNMSFMFFKNRAFNQDISSWDVSNVTSMISMFQRCDSINQDLNSWDVSAVTNMNRMFKDALLFDGGIANWDVENITRMTEMFSGAAVFNQDLSDWCVRFFQYNPPVSFGLNSALVPAHYPRWGNCPQDFDNVTSLATGAFVNANGCVDCSALNIGDYFEMNGDTLIGS
jgi:surface protein